VNDYEVGKGSRIEVSVPPFVGLFSADMIMRFLDDAVVKANWSDSARQDTAALADSKIKLLRAVMHMLTLSS
jgi:hypothetical protein